MTTETRKRREYTEEFKRDAVAPVTEQGYKSSEAARSLGIRDNLIRRWKREFEEEASGAGLSSDEREELALRRRMKELFRATRDCLCSRTLMENLREETTGAVTPGRLKELRTFRLAKLLFS